MSRFKQFEFTEEIINSFREKREIPVHFYNREGQILIYKKSEATDTEIERILRFVRQGIYYDVDDSQKLGLEKQREIPEGLSDTKLLGEKHAEELSRNAGELFDQLKRTSVTSIQTKGASERLARVFSDFENQPDAMIGLVNILELMQGKERAIEVEMAVKRTVVAMALKTRGMQAQTHKERDRMNEMVNILMMSTMLCDIGYFRMKMPVTPNLTPEQMEYIKNHPLMSYIMLAYEKSIDERIKFNILTHHHPLKEGKENNNYPTGKQLISKLNTLQEKYQADLSKRKIAESMREQIRLLSADLPYNEDANIIALSSEFASLTTKTAWREAFPPLRAVRMIINNSHFTYTPRIIREFLDYVAISLCDNQKILNEGDFIIVAARTFEGKTYFEVCQITEINRHQSRPGIDRLATIFPEIDQKPRIRFCDFNLTSLKPDPRHAHYELAMDDSRHIVYCVDPEHDQQLYEELTKLVAGRRHHVPEEKEKEKKNKE